jgi:hypothetical protein
MSYGLEVLLLEPQLEESCARNKSAAEMFLVDLEKNLGKEIGLRPEIRRAVSETVNAAKVSKDKPLTGLIC